MNKVLKKKKQPTKVIRPGEEELIAKAEMLKQQGNAAFGSTERFDFKQDPMAAEMIAKQMIIPQEEINVGPPELDSLEFAEQVYNYQVENNLVEKEDEDTPVKFSDDPAERLDQIVEHYKKQFPNFPSSAEINQLKATYGDVFFVDLGDRVFLHRYLNRQEMIQMELDPKRQNLREDQKQTDIFNRCVLYPRYTVAQYAALPSGLIDTMVRNIEWKSMYLDPREVAMSTVKL